MRRPLVIALAMLPALAAAQTTASYAVVGDYTVDSSSGTQTEPRISGKLVAYTNGDPTSPSAEIHIYTGSGHLIASNGRSPDISGSRVVFTRVDGVTTAIYVGEYDPGTHNVSVRPLADPSAGPLRDRPSIGQDTVAWVDNGPDGNAAASEIVVFDLVTGQPKRIALDGSDAQPA
ncbi:MAG TPA: hypothetical protein VE549_12200, partial [Myxococcaceae bacterium]|nr:hypothetical protein [Myxococcaceae bacterium]